MGRLFRLADGCGFIYVWFYEVVPRQRDPTRRDIQGAEGRRVPNGSMCKGELGFKS